MLNEQNRRSFLHDVSLALGRNDIPEYVEPLDLSQGPQHNLMTGMSQEELVAAFEQECDNLSIKYYESTGKDLPNTLLNVIKECGGGKVIYPKVEEIKKYGIDKMIEKNEGKDDLRFMPWDNEKSGEYNINNAEDANIGVTFPVMGIAETGTVMQPASGGSGRSVGLLPLNHIAIIRRSTIQPRMTQTMAELSKRFAEDPENFPSLMIHISGPSSTVDIELVRVVGVHGPINVTYIILED